MVSLIHWMRWRMRHCPRSCGNVSALPPMGSADKSGPRARWEDEMKPRAAVARKAGEKLSLETIDLDGPREGEVLVEVKATGICHTDEFTLSGADPEGLFPSVLGHEGAGIVMDVGK